MNDVLISVHIGEVKVSNGGHQLQTILGSCIGIGLLWQKHGVYGLAHCLLPEMPESEKCKSAIGKNRNSQKKTTSKTTLQEIACGEGRYVDQAVDCLLSMMNIIHLKDVRAVVAGGANMTKPGAANPEKLVGYQNAQNAIKQLNTRRIIIIDQDIGGENGRKLSICGDSGSHLIRHIPRSAA